MRTHTANILLQGVKLIRGSSCCSVKSFWAFASSPTSHRQLPASDLVHQGFRGWVPGSWETRDSFIVQLGLKAWQTFLRPQGILGCFHPNLTPSFTHSQACLMVWKFSQPFWLPLYFFSQASPPMQPLHIKFCLAVCQKRVHKWTRSPKGFLCFLQALSYLINITFRGFSPCFSRKTSWTYKFTLVNLPTLWTTHTYLEGNFWQYFEKALKPQWGSLCKDRSCNQINTHEMLEDKSWSRLPSFNILKLINQVTHFLSS